MQTKETYGLVLYNRNYREDDKLVKIFTETNGKHMFFVKHAGKSRFNSVIQPLTAAKFILKINDTGLSFIEDYKEVESFKEINADLFRLSYASYVTALADAAVPDGVADPQLFTFFNKTLSLMEEGLDYEILTNIFEIQLLERFGVSLNFHECAFCHYGKDDYRSHLDPNVLYLVDRFQAIHFDELKTISVKPEMKRKLRLFIDDIYDNYVGLRLKSKKFIDDLGTWGNIMK